MTNFPTKIKSIIRLIITFIFCSLLIKGWAAPDPNFHIYICFGQSNMQGVNRPEPEDTTCDDRFLMMATTTCGKQRTLYEWKKATISLAHCHNYLSPMSGFGKEMIKLTNEEIRVGVIVVAVSGASIQLFEEENYKEYLETASDLVKGFAEQYNYNCYERIINCAKRAQKEGVIKGILVHQGEADLNDDSWISRLKGVYENILTDLNLSSDTIPLIVGETPHDSRCAALNNKIAQVPDSIPTSHIVSARGLEGKGDLVHFSNPSYRELGKRYAETMAELLPDSIFKEPIPDPNFYIYLCIGESNMVGMAPIESCDTFNNDRFRIINSIECKTRALNKWRTAIPPLNHCWSGLGSIDHFGRTMCEKTGDSIRIGIVTVGVPGTDIKLFDKDSCESYLQKVKETDNRIIYDLYGGNPYKRFIESAQKAQKEGVIKGILLHHGESNVGDKTWSEKVNRIYHNILDELNLNADSVPLLAGEVLRTGKASRMNETINLLPNINPNFHIVSSEGITEALDDGLNIHFTSEGYREMGRRYANTLLSINEKQDELVYLNETQNVKSPYFLYDKYTISSIGKDVSTISIYSFEGVLIIKTSNEVLDISNLPNGLYIIQAMDKSGKAHSELFVK